MRTKKVNRYWCDFCNKAGLSSGHMRKHELHCTVNPKRECRVCIMCNGASINDPLELSKLVPKIDERAAWITLEEGNLDQESLNEAINLLRKETSDCPACILAAIRQSGSPVPAFQSFDFKSEMTKILNDWNLQREEERAY